MPSWWAGGYLSSVIDRIPVPKKVGHPQRDRKKVSAARKQNKARRK